MESRRFFKTIQAAEAFYMKAHRSHLEAQ